MPQSDVASRKRPRTEDKNGAPREKTAAIAQKTKAKDSKSKDEDGESSGTFLVNTNETPAFPRGGASLLTPAERKQIQAQADRDVLFEQSKANGDLSDSEGGSDGELGREQPQRNKAKKATKKQKKRAPLDGQSSGVRIEGLTYKRLAPGSILLGKISSINQRDISVSLPNNLTGFVPLTSISRQLTEKIENLLKENETQSESESNDEDDDDIDLKSYFCIGQYLRVYVSSTGTDLGAIGSSKKHIELSLEPGLCNNGLKKADVVPNSTIQASVRSVEDHGLIMDLGLEEENVKGFIPTKELGSATKLSDVRPGSVYLCHVLSFDGAGRTIKLSIDPTRLGNTTKFFVTSAPTVDSFLPGTAVEILVSEVTSTGLSGKVMGTLDVVSDIVHSTARHQDVTLDEQYALGQKIKGRLISTFPLEENKKLGFSLLENVLALDNPAGTESKDESEPTRPALSEVLGNVEVVKVDPSVGIYVSLGTGNFEGFAHISTLSDKKVESISGTTGRFKIGSVHKARITGYSALDDLYLLSLQESTISQPFLRIEDVKIAQVTKGKIQKVIISDQGVNGLVVELADGVAGFVPRLHLSDLKLQHPERKFREGLSVNARVLSVDPGKRQLRLTLKKSLVNSDLECWKDYSDIKQGRNAPGTLIKVNPHGAVVQFFGNVKGFLPVSEMSEAFIKDATQHFKEGQVVTVNAISVDTDNQRVTLSCRDPSLMGSVESLRSLKPGAVVSGTVFEKSEDDLLLRLDNSDAIARVELDHVSDGSEKKRRNTLSKIRVGQKLQDLLVLDVLERRRIVRLSNKSSLTQASKDGTLLTDYSELRESKKVTGYVSRITPDGVFVAFASGLSGRLRKKDIAAADVEKPDFGLSMLQTVSLKIGSIDYKESTPRFWLTQKENTEPAKLTNGSAKVTFVQPVDGTSTSLDDLPVGAVTKARIVSVKDTQLNVEIAKDIQGRIDVSEIFDNWTDIKDRKRPLRNFDTKQILEVRVLGAHDARNHRFLPITHRSGKAPVFEFSAKPSFVKSDDLDILTLDKVKPGSLWIAYVNNISDNYLWVNLSPNVRGRIAAMDLTDDLSQLSDLEENFPVGSALKVHVVDVDLEKSRLDLSAKPAGAPKQIDYKDISKGLILPGRVTKASERQLLVQLSDMLVGAVNLVDIADDYKEANPLNYQKNDVVRVYVLGVDAPNKKIVLSLRPSKVLSSSLPVKDPEISSVDQLKVNDIYRGFITNVVEKGIFVALGQNVTAFVRVSNLSDKFIKDWQEHFQRDQLVKGKIISVDTATNHVQMSLKESLLDKDYTPPLSFTDLKVGQVVTGKVAKVHDFGVFIVVDNSANIRGLCHRSEIAEQRIEDVTKIFNEGDVVKAKVLKIDPEKRRVNFGLKASYFVDDEDEEMLNEDDVELVSDEEGGVDIDMLNGSEGDEDDEADEEIGSDDDEDEDDVLDDVSDNDDENSGVDIIRSTAIQPRKTSSSEGLNVGGFNWFGLTSSSSTNQQAESDVEEAVKASRSKKKKSKAAPEASIDRTGDLDANGPQASDDFERLLLVEPDSSLLWLQYMAFHLELGEIEQARQIAQRALQTIGIGQDAEKLNIWIAMLNLENTYGDEESIQETFKKACQYNDPEEIHTRLTSIYIQSGKLDVSSPPSLHISLSFRLSLPLLGS